MKRMNIAGRYSVLILVMLSMTLLAYTQDGKATSEDRKEQRQWEMEQRKLEKEKLKEQAAEITKVMVDSQRFVLEANQLGNRYGVRATVSPNINFIMVNSNAVTLQLGSAFAIGYNGVGGQTLDGRVTRYEVKRTGRDDKNYNINMTVMTSASIYDIFLTITEEGNADARIRSNWSGELSYYGKLVPLGLSKVYKGQPTY